MQRLLFLCFTAACVPTQKGSTNQILTQACVSLCEQQRAGSGCESVQSGSDCEQSCDGIVASVPSECEQAAEAAWNCLSDASWTCVDGSSPQLDDSSCEAEQNQYLDCIEGNDTAG